MYEGGIRVPFILRYPKAIKAGQVYSKPVSALDLYPTFCNLAGAIPNHSNELDGVDLIPYISGEKRELPHEILYWYGANKGAVRYQNYKYCNYKGKGELYNLSVDISESIDLSDSFPKIKEDLETKYHKFIASLPPPLNPDRYDKFNPDKP